MDPFTEKLLARTQARKAALSNKREEVARRSPAVNSPRRPLAQNNAANLPSTPTNTPLKGSSVVVTSAPFAGGTPKSVFYEKFSKQASLKQKECFIELGETKAALRSTTTTTKIDTGAAESQVSSSKPKESQKMAEVAVKPIESIQKVSVTATVTESPSVKDRKAMYMKQVQVESENAKSISTTNVKQSIMHDKPDIERPFPSVKEPRVSLAGKRFFTDPSTGLEQEPVPAIPEKTVTSVPLKPPRATVPKVKQEQEDKSVKEVPAKPPRSAAQPQTAATAAAPLKPPRVQVTKVDIELSKTASPSSCSNVKRKAPTPPVETQNAEKMEIEPGANSSEQKSSLQKAPKRCEEEIKSDIPKKKTAIEGNNEVEMIKSKNVVTPDRDHSAAAGAKTAQYLRTPEGMISPIVKESTPTRGSGKKRGDKQHALKSQKISAISLGDMVTDDNQHEITFNIDMAEFDQVLEDDKESMFQMTYDERIAKAGEMKPTEKSSEMMSASLQAVHKGVHKSGYNSIYSDQYAAVVTPKKVKAAPTRNYTVHEKIQMLLEEAAFQQNIVLQASQAVNTCLVLHDGLTAGSMEEIEAERLLKFSTERRTACLNEVQKLKNGEEESNAATNDKHNDDQLPCKATLKISGIKIPVDKKLLQNNNPLEPCIHSFICMMKHTPKQMYCTKAVTSDEIKNGCAVFDDVFQIKNVKPSFSLEVCVYVLKVQLPSATPTNKHKRKTISAKSVLDSPKIKQIIGTAKKSCDSISQAVTPGSTQGPVFRTSGFTLVATANINLTNIHHGRYGATQVGDKSYLNGDLKLDLSCSPEYFNEAKGFLTIFEDVGGLGDWLRYWCILDGNVLRYWKYPDDELMKSPLGSINLGYCVSESVTVVPRDICARPHTMQLVLEKPVTSADRDTLIAVNAGSKMVIKYMISADTKVDKTTWLNTLNDSLKDSRAWHCKLTMDKTNKKSETDILMV